MRPNLNCVAFKENLLHESIHDILSLDPVLFFYIAVFVTVLVLWTIGVFAFGRASKARHAAVRPADASKAERATPVAS